MSKELKELIKEELIANTKVYDCRINIPKVYGELYYPYTQTSLSVYKPICWFKRLMLKWCFGLEYKKI